MDYPTEQEIHKRLKPFIFLLWAFSALLLALGAFLGWRGLIPEALSRAGALTVLLALAIFFFLEKREFLTGRSAGLWDSSHHVVPKGIIGPHVTVVTIVGSMTAIFGDLVLPVLKCGAIKC